MQAARDFKLKALEITMRNVMDNLEEDASWQMLYSKAWAMEILSIEPETTQPRRNKAPVTRLFPG